ncbi:YeiH family protein [Planctomicrobium sp. SH527]|uniref:YeiH family protein n=1 Tax=Planctomicrobium sp. SH527 TaxID=3448123 RepID=UPI003F5BD710
MNESASPSEPKEIPLVRVSRLPELLRTEDWWAIWLGGFILLLVLAATLASRPDDTYSRVERYHQLTQEYDALREQKADPDGKLKDIKKQREAAKNAIAVNPLSQWTAKLQSWTSNPIAAFSDKSGKPIFPGLLGVFVILALTFTLGIKVMGGSAKQFLIAFVPVFLLAIFAYVLAGQKVIKHYNLEYALWAIMVGLIISNTLGTPRFMLPAVRTEFYIKTGLVLLGAEILFSQLLSLGLPGIGVSWVTTPIVLITTFIFGQKILKMSSPSLNMVISADMSVCGVSAAIATGAACRAKKEELSLAIALSLGFTVIMMIVMPAFINSVNMDPVVAGAWLGGTIDSTGAVAAAGGMVGDTALTVAATIKMIQNILIGAVAFAVSIYWVGWVEKSESTQRVGLGEIWRRFPKFMLGFLAASIAFSYMATRGIEGEATVNAVLKGTTEPLRGWLFCLAFVSIGLETNFRQLMPYFKGGKPLVLYVVGQTLNLMISLFMAWVMFVKVFPNAADALRQ